MLSLFQASAEWVISEQHIIMNPFSNRFFIKQQKFTPEKRNWSMAERPWGYYRVGGGFFSLEGYSLLCLSLKSLAINTDKNPFVGLLFRYYLTTFFLPALAGFSPWKEHKFAFEFMLWKGYIHHVINWYTLPQSRLNGSSAMFSQRVR